MAKKQRVGELYAIFYDNDIEVVNKLEEMVEETGLRKRDIVVKALKSYLLNNETTVKSVDFQPIKEVKREVTTTSKMVVATQSEEDLFSGVED